MRKRHSDHGNVLIFLLFQSARIFPSSHAYSQISAKWADLTDSINPIVPPRSGHVAFAPADAPSQPRIFGGYVEEVDANGEVERHASNDMWAWEGAPVGWTRIEQEAEAGTEIPRPRLASAAALVNDRPVLFGGWDPQVPGTGGEILDTLKEFDTNTNCWSVIDAKIPDGPTSRHVALGLPNGDALLHNHRCSNHVYLFSTDGRFNKQPTTGIVPSSRGLHAATMAGDMALIFGGAAQNGQMSNEAFLLDTSTWEWKDVLTEGPVPCPRAAPCLCTISNNCALMFGGAEATDAGLNPRADVWALHFDAGAGTGRWELLVDDVGGGDNTPPGGPPPRNAATLSEIEYIDQAFDGPAADGEVRKCFVLQGGWAPFRKTWNDCFVLSVSLQ